MHVAILCDFPLHALGSGHQFPPEVHSATPVENLVAGLAECDFGQLSIVTVKKGLKSDLVIKIGERKTAYLLRSPYGSGMPVAFIPRVQRIAHLLRRLRPDIVHGQGTERENALAAIRSGFPSLITVHGILREIHAVTKPHLLSPNRIGRLTEDYVFARAHNIVAISSYAKQRLASYSRASVFQIPNAVSEIYFSIRRRPVQPTFIFVGSIYPLKGVSDFIRAARIVDQKGHRAHFIIVGPVCDPDYFRILCREAALFRNCTFEYAGRQSSEWIANRFQTALALVHPSHAENAPMVVAEALAAGLPVIGTSVGAIPEWIHSGRNGWTVSVHDIAAIADRMLVLLGNRSRSEEMSYSAKAMASQFRPLTVARQTLALYSHILEKNQLN